MQYLTSAAFQAKEESKIDDHIMAIKFPPEAIMNIEQVNFSRPINLVNSIIALVQRRLASAPSNHDRNDSCHCCSRKNIKGVVCTGLLA